MNSFFCSIFFVFLVSDPDVAPVEAPAGEQAVPTKPSSISQNKSGKTVNTASSKYGPQKAAITDEELRSHKLPRDWLACCLGLIIVLIVTVIVFVLMQKKMQDYGLFKLERKIYDLPEVKSSMGSDNNSSGTTTPGASSGTTVAVDTTASTAPP